MERLLSTVLKGTRTEWPFATGEREDEFLAAVSRHAVQALVASRVREGVLANVPPRVAQALSRSAVQQAAVEEVFAAELRRVVAGFSDAGVRALLMKGGALAYTHYPDPSLRPRTDCDLMLPREDVDRAGRVLEALGYTAFNLITGELVMNQCTWLKTDQLGLRHVYDLHWTMVNPRIASDLFTWGDLAARAVAVPQMGPAARAFGNPHALLLACVHRLAHHFDDDRLLWLYDIHVLGARMNDDEWAEFGRYCSQPAVAAMCRRSLAAAVALLGTAVPRVVVRRLDAVADDDALDAFTGRARRIDLVLSDLGALPSWRDRLRLAREHLFPPPEFMKRQYGVTNRLLLPAFYVRRWVVGAHRWFRPLMARPR